jgi:3-hydroxyisobutyrate dehydrogenase-like beta-hydroxyacid dehydrogenase
MDSSMNLGFLGLGQMGAAIAANLLRAGHHLTVWNRSPGKAQALLQAGAVEAASPGLAAAGKDMVFTMLADDAALDAVLNGGDGLLRHLPAGALHICLGTIAVATADRVAALHAEQRQRYLAAPVFGRPDLAAAGKLSIVAGGSAADVADATPLFQAIGQRIFHVGDKPSAANLVKLCGNFAILSAVETMAEAMTLAEKGGVPKAKLLEVLLGTLFDAPAYRVYGPILVEERFRPAALTATLGLKDMRLVAQAAETSRVPMPLLNVLRDHLLQTIATEGEDIDWSAIGRAIARNSGL